MLGSLIAKATRHAWRIALIASLIACIAGIAALLLIGADAIASWIMTTTASSAAVVTGVVFGLALSWLVAMALLWRLTRRNRDLINALDNM